MLQRDRTPRERTSFSRTTQITVNPFARGEDLQLLRARCGIHARCNFLNAPVNCRSEEPNLFRPRYFLHFPMRRLQASISLRVGIFMVEFP